MMHFMNIHTYHTLSDDILNNLYDLRKAQDATRYLIAKTVGINGLMSEKRLGELLYLAEREFFKRYGEPLTGDTLSHSDDSVTLQKTQAWLRGQEFGYEGVVEIQPDMSLRVIFPESHSSHDEKSQQFELARAQQFFKRDTHLSDADIDVLDFILLNFIHMTSAELADYISHQCVETSQATQNPTITHITLLEALGYGANEINGILDHLEEISCLNMAFTQIRY